MIADMGNSTENTELTVSQAADFLGVTVRTLHHWDAKGLLVPQVRTWSDYRIYTADDLARGQRILVYRESGVPLGEIGELLEATGDDEREHLLRQRELLRERREGVDRMLAAVEDLLAEVNSGVYTGPVPPERVREILGPDWDPDYQREAEERWGDTDEWRDARQVMSQMGEDDWRAVREEGDAFARALAEAHDRGVAPGSEEGDALAERQRRSISRWYDCPHSRQVILSAMYVGDARFRTNWTVDGVDHTDYLVELIRANAAARGVDVENPQW